MTKLNFKNQTDLHKHFSTHCFNKAWELIDKTDQSEEKTEEMVHYAIASLFHWSKRDDCTDRHKSVGCWQVSRCYALAGDVAAKFLIDVAKQNLIRYKPLPVI